MMRSVLLVFFAVAVVIAWPLYLFLPLRTPVPVSIQVKASSIAALRQLSSDSGLLQTWPAGSRLIHGTFLTGKYVLTAVNRFPNGVSLEIQAGKQRFDSRLLAEVNGKDSLMLRWTVIEDSSRAGHFPRLTTARLENEMKMILGSMQRFLNNPDSLYGYHMTDQPFLDDTLLVMTRKRFRFYPATDDIYDLVGLLERHIDSTGIRKTGSPLISIATDSDRFELMVGLPVSAAGRNSGAIRYQKMLGGWFVKTEVTGGRDHVGEAVRQAKFYIINTYKTPLPAHFESLVSDRRKSADSTTWTTVIYYPFILPDT